MNILDDIATWITTTSTGFTTDYGIIGTGSTVYPVYKLIKPPSTANMHVLYQSGGQGPQRVTGVGDDKVNIQVMTLSAATSDLGYSHALRIQDRLRFVNNSTLGSTSGVYYISITPIQAPIGLGKDQNDRYQWSQNFAIELSAT